MMKSAIFTRLARCRVDLRRSIRLGKKNALKETQKRNWLDLPQDVMIHIFMKVGVVDLLFSAQNVCSLWRSLAKDPQIFRCIDMRNHWHVFGGSEYYEEYDSMVREALSRCRDGELVEFSMEYFATDEHIHLAIEKSRSKLRCLRLVSAYQVSDYALIEIAKTNPLLEEIELCLCSFDAKTIAFVGRCCPHLESFRLNAREPGNEDSYVYDDSHAFDFNEEASAIANNMPQLRRLHLFNNSMSNKGLQAILDKCLHLEYLDLRQCFGVNLEGGLLQKCVARVQDLRLPSDSTDDYEFDIGDSTMDGDDESDMNDDVDDDGSDVYDDVENDMCDDDESNTSDDDGYF